MSVASHRGVQVSLKTLIFQRVGTKQRAGNCRRLQRSDWDAGSFVLFCIFIANSVDTPRSCKIPATGRVWKMILICFSNSVVQCFLMWAAQRRKKTPWHCMKLHQSRRITYITSGSILQNNSGEKTFAKTVLWSNWRQCCTSHGHTSSRWSDKMFFLCLDSIRTLALTVRGGGGEPGNFFDTWLVVMHDGNAADLMRRRIWFSGALTRWLDMRDRRRTGEDEGSRDLRWKDSWGAD